MQGKSYAIHWLKLALRDMHEIGVFLTQNDAEAATQVVQSIWDAGQSLSVSPSRGRPGRVAGTREYVHIRYPYILVYRVNKQHVQIIRVLHTARQYP